MNTPSRQHNYSLTCLLSGLVLWHLVTATAPAQQQQSLADEAADPAALMKPFVSETTALVLRLDPAGIALPDLQGRLEPMTPEAKAAYAEFTERLAAGREQLRQLADGQPIFATVGIPISHQDVPVFLFTRTTSDERSQRLVKLLRDELQLAAAADEQYIVASPKKGGPAPLRPPSAAERDAVAEAFQAVAGNPAQLLLLPPDHVWRTIRELSPELPPQLGGGPSRVLTDGVRWAAVGIDPAKLRTEIVIQSASADAARDFASHLPKLVRSAYELTPPDYQKILAEIKEPLMGALKPQVEGSQVRIVLDGLQQTEANFKLLAAVAQTLEQHTRRRSNQNKLKQILLGMHNYHDTHQSFPPADKHRDDKGRPSLSWRVHILPYVDELALYRKFHLDEPWDSPHNKPLLAKMPNIFSTTNVIGSRDRPAAGHTTFLAPVGEGTIFGGVEAVEFQDIIDGTSNTIAVLEVTPGRAVPWTAPQDFRFDPERPLNGVLIGPDKRWLCAFADGSVQQLRGDIPAEVVLRLYQMNDRQPVDYREIR